MIATEDRDVAGAREWFRFYRDVRGFQPLPSRPDEKRPFTRYAEWWCERAPADLFDRHPTTNLQIMLGRYWGLLVIDLDGPEAVAVWPRLCPRQPRTWVTHSGGGGRHVWFSVPKQGHPLPKAVLWRPDPTKPRQKGEPAVERLCDRSLVMAPPSVHPRTGNRYRFLAGCSPKDVPMPAPCPAAVLSLRPVQPPAPSVPLLPRPEPKQVAPHAGNVRSADVLAAVTDKAALARSWGLRLASERPNHAGWCECHAVGREDAHPSASFSPTSGSYWEPDRGVISFFDLAALLGVYSDWRDARADLADRYRVKGIA